MVSVLSSGSSVQFQAMAGNIVFVLGQDTLISRCRSPPKFKMDTAKFTALFNNMRTLTFKAQPTNAFFATINQVFGDSSQLPTTVERAVIKSLSNIQIMKQCSAVAGS